MSYLKDSLEKAKVARLSRLAREEGPPRPIERTGQVLRFYDYTRTRVVGVSTEMLLRNRIVAVGEESPVNQQFKLLRTQLFQSTRQKGINSVQVTGFEQGDGASLIAANLAISIARDTRQTTLLVELNFRTPSIGRLFGLDPKTPGLKSYLLDGVPVEDLLLSPGIKKLTLLMAGGKIASPTELLGSPGMEDLLREIKQRYEDRYIILDTPAICECADPLVLSEYVDGIIVVARANHTSRDSLKSAMDLLPKEKILGMVLNDVPDDEIGG